MEIVRVSMLLAEVEDSKWNCVCIDLGVQCDWSNKGQ